MPQHLLPNSTRTLPVWPEAEIGKHSPAASDVSIQPAMMLRVRLPEAITMCRREFIKLLTGAAIDGSGGAIAQAEPKVFRLGTFAPGAAR